MERLLSAGEYEHIKIAIEVEADGVTPEKVRDLAMAVERYARRYQDVARLTRELAAAEQELRMAKEYWGNDEEKRKSAELQVERVEAKIAEAEGATWQWWP